MIEWLEGKQETISNDITYSLDKAKERYQVKELCRDGWLILNWDAEKLWLKFAVLEFSSSDSDGNNILTNCLFHGEGPSGNLRECRHTWWGEEGYIFYPDGKIITAAFEALSEFFNDMKAESAAHRQGEKK